MADERPVLVYDGACRFCVAQAERLARLAGRRIRLESFRDAGVLERHPELTREACERAAQLVEPDGRVRSGAEAVVHAVALRAGLTPLKWLYHLPVVRQVADLGYRLVARNRFRLQGEVCTDDTCRLHD